MSQFKVGDKVVVVNGGYWATKVGSIGTVVDLNSLAVYCEWEHLTGTTQHMTQEEKDCKGANWAIRMDDVELATPLQLAML